MKGRVQKTIKKLAGEMMDALPRTGTEELESLLNAIVNGRVHFEFEPWNPLSPRKSTRHLPAEMLLRAQTMDGHTISPEGPVKHINALGLNRTFDQIIVLSAVEQALERGQFPVSINISSRNACDADSLVTLHDLIESHFGNRIKPNQIIFELLEDHQADDVNPQALDDMQALGYQFAIDDQSHDMADSARLENLGPHVHIVKIDRATVLMMEECISRADHPGQHIIRDLFNRITEHAPHATVLLEGVQNAATAVDLKQAYGDVALVQGRDLSATFSGQYKAALKDSKHPAFCPVPSFRHAF